MAYNLENFQKDFMAIEHEIANVIIGQKSIIKDVLCAVIAGGNVLLEGLPGLGKTEMIKAIAAVLELEFSRIQFTPDLMPQDVTGTDILVKDSNGNAGFKFQKGPIFANIILADEINRATPKTQSALLEAMQEGTVTSGAHTYQLPEPFFVMATQNPLEMEGTYPLPEAQMDRFMIKLDIEFPNETELGEIVRLTTENNVKKVHKVFNGADIMAMGQGAKEVPVSKSVLAYGMKLVMMTHPAYKEAPETVKKYVRYGASPRGAQGLIQVAKIYALLDGRYNVAFEDINKACIPVLNHRLFMNFEAAADGISQKNIIENILLSGEKIWKA